MDKISININLLNLPKEKFLKGFEILKEKLFIAKDSTTIEHKEVLANAIDTYSLTK
ncbi:MAG: hypothetical protein MHPSP_001476, partial [Paramarteilia canceri]